MRPEDGLVNHLFFVFAFSFLFPLGEHNKEKNVITRLINLRSLSFPGFKKEKKMKNYKLFLFFLLQFVPVFHLFFLFESREKERIPSMMKEKNKRKCNFIRNLFNIFLNLFFFLSSMESFLGPVLILKKKRKRRRMIDLHSFL